MTKRAGHIDVAKGLAILLVVIGHSWLTLKGSPKLFNVIYSFHVPAFFLLSGLFFQPTQAWGDMVASRVDSLLKPYVFSLLPLMLAVALLTKAGAVLPFAGLFYGSGPTIGDLPQWFLPCMFCVFVLARLLVPALRLDQRPLPVQLAMLSAILVGGVGLLRYTGTLSWSLPFAQSLSPEQLQALQQTQPWGLPWGLDIAPVALSFFLLGFVLRRHFLDASSHWLSMLFAGVVFVGLHAHFDFCMDLNLRRYDHLLVSTLQALAGIWLLLGLSRLLTPVAAANSMLTYFGRHTLLILLFHSFLLNAIFAIVRAWAPQRLAELSLLSVMLTLFAMVGLIRLVYRTDWLAAVLLPRRGAPPASNALPSPGV